MAVRLPVAQRHTNIVIYFGFFVNANENISLTI